MDLDPQNPDHRPPYVDFVTRSVEDRAQPKNDLGMYHLKDLVIAKITRPGQKDTVERDAEDWVKSLHKQAHDGRIPQAWVEHFSRALEAYKQGQEVPVNGTPIRGWGCLTPAQQETIVRAGVRTVEDLAALNAEGIAKLGMGGVTWKNAATAWMAQQRDKGAVASEVADLKRDNTALQESLAEAHANIKLLSEQLAALRPEPVKATL